MARARSGGRLDQPRAPRGLRRPHYDPEAFGKFSESIARFFGTARFLIIHTGLVLLWIGYNGFVGYRLHAANEHCRVVHERDPAAECEDGRDVFDPYPFILLNLAFSTQAAYAAPLILLAQTRQAERDRLSLEQDRAQYARALADTEYLTREVASIRVSVGDVATRDFLRSELQRLLDELREDEPPPNVP